MTLNFAIGTSDVYLKILFSNACGMNITQKRYNKIHLNDVLALTFFCYILCTLVLLLLIYFHKYV